ncbi:MAG: hypothetical protein ABSG19_05340 [Candidatus Aminicenantales bacterium]
MRPRPALYSPPAMAPSKLKRASSFLALLAIAILLPVSVSAQFFDDFNGPLKKDPDGVTGWAFFTGEGRAVMDFVQGPGYASILVDATGDRRGVWWALIKHKVSDRMDLGLLGKPGYALRIEARIRVSHAPRRVNLHLNTQKTTDFHSHLMEFDIPDTTDWHTISMTTQEFQAGAGDTVNGQMALMDWGLGKYRVDVDYFRVDVVNTALAGPDEGEAVPYHPPVADPKSFACEVRAAADSTVDLDNPDVNLNNWYVRDAGKRTRIVTAGGTRLVILRFDLGALTGKKVEGHGLLELTTRSLERASDEIPDFGLIRIVEIPGGDPRWDQKTVTFNSFCRGMPVDSVLNPQMIIDWPVTEGDGGKTYLTISKPVLQRLIDGKTLGIAIKPLGAINASFYSMEENGGKSSARLLFNLRK